MMSLFELMPHLTAYSVSFVVLAALSLITLVQNFLTAPLAFVNEEQVPGMPLRHDHSRMSFRALRTYSNSAETLPAFGWAVLVAVVAGVSAPVVNGLAMAYLACRLAFWILYYAGIGRIAGGPRTMAFVGGLLANMGLAITALWVLTTQ